MSDFPHIHALVPAAGLSRRMKGHDKLMMEIDGVALLRRSVLALVGTAVSRIVVVLGHRKDERSRTLAGMPVDCVTVHASTPRLSASLLAGYRSIGEDCDGILIHLPDMPDITTGDIDRVISGFTPDMPVRATTSNGMPGHPVLIPRSSFRVFDQMEGDRGIDPVFRMNRTGMVHVPLPGERALTDLDTAECWENWLHD